MISIGYSTGKLDRKTWYFVLLKNPPFFSLFRLCALTVVASLDAVSKTRHLEADVEKWIKVGSVSVQSTERFSEVCQCAE